LPKASLRENPSLKKRGTLKWEKDLPFSFQEKGQWDEFLKISDSQNYWIKQ